MWTQNCLEFSLKSMHVFLSVLLLFIYVEIFSCPVSHVQRTMVSEEAVKLSDWIYSDLNVLTRRWSSLMVPGFVEKDLGRQMVFVSHFLLLMQQILILKQALFSYFTMFLKYTFLFCGLFLHKFPWILYTYNLQQKYYIGPI